MSDNGNDARESSGDTAEEGRTSELNGRESEWTSDDDAANDDEDDDDSYEPEYEMETVVVKEDLVFQVMSVLPPPLDYISNLRTNDSEISGRRVWTGSLLLSRAIARDHDQDHDVPIDLDKKRVLELGCGTGLASMTAAAAATTVTHGRPQCIAVTDGDPIAVQLFEQNLMANADKTCGVAMAGTLLRWTTTSNDAFSSWCRATWPHLLQDACFDVILAADVLYKSSLLRPFFATVRRFAAPGGELWLCHIPRANVTHEMVETAARNAGLSRVERIPLHCNNNLPEGCVAEEAERAVLYRITQL